MDGSFRTTAPAVSARGLRKRYGKDGVHTDALLGVDLEVRPGEILGVLGPNGAGKTTLIEILEGQRQADGGTARVLGCDIADRNGLKSIRHRMGVSVQNTVLPPLLTVEELLQLHCTLFPQSHPVDDLVEQVGLGEKRDARIKSLSGGQQQRVAVALALAGDPELIFLDEPTSQLDPQARRAVWAVLERQRQRRNAAMLITTHQMEEAQRICDRVVILDHGEIIAEGRPSELVDRHCPQQLVEFLTGPDADLAFLGDAAQASPDGSRGARVRVRSDHSHEVVSELIARQSRGQLEVRDLRMDRQSLEDVFVQLTGRRIRD